MLKAETARKGALLEAGSRKWIKDSSPMYKGNAVVVSRLPRMLLANFMRAGFTLSIFRLARDNE